MEPSPAELKEQHAADRRVRELYRYYQPAAPPGVIRSWLSAGEDLPPAGPAGSPNTPPVDDARGSNSSATPTPSTALGPEELVLGSSNITLRSFAQLAALRLNAQRALICVLDRNTQYILSEATKTVNLNDSSVHDPKDALWLGTTGSTKAWSLCLDTVALPPSDRENANYEYLIVNDLTEHERFKRLSFVENDPRFRFYAGTPLTTKNGINLGCFFVLDTDTRDGLTGLEKDTLGSLATLVMDYLKVCRQASEGRRAARLSRGLSCFVEGSSSFVDSVDPSRVDSARYSGTTASLNNRISMSGSSRAANSFEHTSQRASNDRASQTASNDHVSQTASDDRASQTASHDRISPSAPFDHVPFQMTSTDTASQVVSPSPPNDRSLSNDARSFSSGLSESKVDTGTSGGASSLPEWLTNSNRNRLPQDDSHGNSWCFRRAANLLRESLDLSNDGGVIFLEASNPSLADIDSGSDASTADGDSGPATVLSMSTNDEPFSMRSGPLANVPAASLDRSFLSILLRRYPKGKLWSFHRDGLISTSDDDDQEPHLHGFQASNISPPGHPPIAVTKPLGKRRKAGENSILNRYFPNATQIIFVPLWNAVNSQWFAGCFCWTTVETQVFTSAVELSSVLGFGSSIMAESSRVESLIADRQKGDFIGSISHELRSPLHGILAAAEFLNATSLTEFQDSLLETVNACGRTLLDTMNQVLDFSKVLASHLDTYVATDLAILAEEVVEGICLGHAYGQNSTASADLPVLMSHKMPKLPPNSRSNVNVTIHVTQRDWVYRTQPGALRRIIMNLFGNAMKYTDAGQVSLSLEASSHSEGRSRRQGLEDLVTLTVSDTGRGISEEFLRGRLYTPFAQEDTLAVGTGLGLSIVRSLVKALNGNIRVRSRPGEGTIVRVSLPLARPVGAESPRVDEDSQNAQQREILTQTLLLREGYPGKRVAIWGTEPADLENSPTWAGIARYLVEWFGIEIVAWPPSVPIDILLVEASSLPDLRQNGLSAALPALLILCEKAVDYSAARAEWLSLATSVDMIRRPCGPHKLARSVLKCLTHGNSTVVTPALTLQDPMDLPIRTSTPVPDSELASAMASPINMSQVGSPTIPDVTTMELTGTGPRSEEDSPPQTPSVVSAPPEAIVAAPLPPPLSDNAIDSTRLARVLVVDDNRINVNLMMTFMKKRKLTELHSAENGKLAVEAVEQMTKGYDIIFMDISMPVMNGFEATRAIRSLERENEGDGRRPAIIIALTGLSSSRDESEALASGVDLFLTKPVSFKEVSRLLGEWEKDGMERERRTAS
ncbi:hypothetical protein N7492_007598 [Penicillium capsulatum]|uniref:histidine kinase n=1 Tax=Penicillium capsulatum TaxID=69766 RepID=A0A9W9I297_9EURO|nr:hypothetical protein N7492_007598 [Penicillium capsulatum]